MKAGYWSNGEDLAGERADARADALVLAVEHEIDDIENEPARIATVIREALADGTDGALIDDLANLLYQRKTTTGTSIAVAVAVNRLVSEFERIAQPYAYAALKARAA
ncbi:MAG: hypothetical protein KGP14_00885 [Betaproteobacteria bacterium]|nr:hypothetical protein [Betaproteobacteria bacterium]